MNRKALPRIVSVVPGEKSLTLQIRWNARVDALVDVSAMANGFKSYAPLRRNPELFKQVRVGEHGTDIVWPGDLDMPADTLWRLTREQSQTANLKTYLLSGGFAPDKADAFDAALSEVRKVGPQLAPRTVRFKK